MEYANHLNEYAPAWSEAQVAEEVARIREAAMRNHNAEVYKMCYSAIDITTLSCNDSVTSVTEFARKTAEFYQKFPHIPNVAFDCFVGLLVDYMRRLDAGIVLQGLRAVTDFESEFQMAQINHQISPEVETLFLMTDPNHAYLSSSAVREIGMFGGDVSPFVPSCIVKDVQCALDRRE